MAFYWSLNYRTDTIKLGEKIGSGAQAEIFKAKCGLDDVVVKRFLNTTHKSTKQEVEILKQLTHKHIVQFYHVHHDMFVMEYVEGGSLADAIVRRGLKTWEDKMQIAKHISLGLAYLHSQGIIHCDIKSSNILLTEHHEARICDFGLARRVGEPGVGGGTLQWMAPELLQDLPLYTSKSDVYALGMVMWEMASESTQPYRNHTPDGTVYCILNGTLEEYPHSTPKDYADCIQTCWKKLPEDRPTAVDMLPDIAQSSYRQSGSEHKQRSATNKGEKIHYRNGLRKYIEGPGSKENGKIMNWFSTPSDAVADAIFRLGGMHYDGRGVEQDFNQALEYFLAASEAGVIVATLKVSDMYRHGRGTEQDDSEAALWYSRAEEEVKAQSTLGNRTVHHGSAAFEHHTATMEWFNVGDDVATSLFNIGEMYYYGERLEQDYGKALEWYLKASDAGDANAMFSIGYMYGEGQGVDQDYGKALEWYLQASDAGNVDAKSSIAALYEQGFGVEQDCGTAMAWYLEASDAGEDSAIFKVGMLYSQGGPGVDQDYEQALDCFISAGENGDSDVMCAMGFFFYEDVSIEQNYAKALHCFHSAGDDGDADAMYAIGVMYELGQGTEQDYDEAMEWYRKASDSGNAMAMCSIGEMYENGHGVGQDHGKAMEWFLEASNAGDASAMCKIGDLYRYGKGILEDESKAFEWYAKAHGAGWAEASVRIREMQECKRSSTDRLQ